MNPCFGSLLDKTLITGGQTEPFLANVNSRSCSQYAVARPSVVCLSVCNTSAPYSGAGRL